jgi:hypothetical protein
MAELQQTQILPAPFIEAAGKTYLEDLTSAVGGIKGLDLSKLYGPQFVAGQSALQGQAEGLASGLGGYQPFLQAAQAATGPAAYQQYMSPYQQDVIDTTLQEYDIQAQKGMQPLAAQSSCKLVHLMVEEDRNSKRQNINQRATGIEQHYKLNYYNKVLDKRNN